MPQLKKKNTPLIDRMIEVSGLNEFDSPNGQVVLVYSNRFSDGTATVVDEISVPLKPVIQCFKHAGFVNVLIDFMSRQDADLAIAWDMLSRYFDPMNSVDWSFEEMESGFFIDENGEEQLVYYPMIEVIILPSKKVSLVDDHKDVFQLHGRNPAFFTLQPNGPKSDPCVLQLTFLEDWFTLEDEIEPLDMENIHEEILEEMRMEMGAGIDPQDLKQ